MRSEGASRRVGQVGPPERGAGPAPGATERGAPKCVAAVTCASGALSKEHRQTPRRTERKERSSTLSQHCSKSAADCDPQPNRRERYDD